METRINFPGKNVAFFLDFGIIKIWKGEDVNGGKNGTPHTDAAGEQ